MSDYRGNPGMAQARIPNEETVMFKRIKAWWAAEGALVQLQGVSDRMLADMGLEREDLRARVLDETAPERLGCGTCGMPAAGRAV
jgi:uncharacterized protein YjiS (DUF1127 family)